MAARRILSVSGCFHKNAKFGATFNRKLRDPTAFVSVRGKSAAASSQIPFNDAVSEQQEGAIAERTPSTKYAAEDCYQKLDLSFRDTEEAYRSKPTWELLRALSVLKISSYDFFVDRTDTLMKLGRRVLGRRLFNKTMKSTIFGQYVAGEDQESIKPVVENIGRYGVKSILDYSAEEDMSEEEAVKAEMESCVSANQPPGVAGENKGEEVQFRAHEKFGDRRQKVVSARTFFYESESKCDKNMWITMNCIDAVSGATNATGMAAVKLTSLGRPQLLLQMSEVIVQMRRVFAQLQDEGGKIQWESFKQMLKEHNVIITRDERSKYFRILDIAEDGNIDLFDWNNLTNVDLNFARIFRVPNIEGRRNIKVYHRGVMEPLVTALNDQEEEQMKHMLKRINTIAEHGLKNDVRIMVDAEQSYFQPAINRLVVEMQRKFNKDKAIIFNTYQCYLKEAFNMVTCDMALAEKENFCFGAKFVRGAYMEQERARAAELGYEDPINPSLEATANMYQRCIDEAMRQAVIKPKGKISVMAATHNEDTIRNIINKMRELDIHPSDKLICFGQLYGMCDQISFPLGQAGYSVYKYVPYGPLEEVIPYLSRRAQENRGIMEKAQVERALLWNEVKRRAKSGQLMYKPTHPEVTASY